MDVSVCVTGLSKSAIPQLKNTSMNWADSLHAGSDGIIFGYNMNVWPLNTGTPLQLLTCVAT